MRYILLILLISIFNGCSVSYLVGDEEGSNSTKVIEGESFYAPVSIFHLSAPPITIDSAFFRKDAKIEIGRLIPGAFVAYTSDGSTPLRGSKVVNGSLIVDGSGVYIFKAFHKDYKDSESISATLRKIGSKSIIIDLDIDPSPHPNYSSNLSNLYNGVRGSINFSSDKEWLGFLDKEVAITVRCEEATVSLLSLSILVDQGAWIFAPREVRVYSGDKLIASNILAIPESVERGRLQFIDVELPKAAYSNLRIEVTGVDGIPSWHQDSGKRPWFFIDEVILE